MTKQQAIDALNNGGELTWDTWDGKYTLNGETVRYNTACALITEMSLERHPAKQAHAISGEYYTAKAVEAEQELETLTEKEVFKKWAPCFNFEKDGAQIIEKLVEGGLATKTADGVQLTQNYYNMRNAD